MDAWPKNGKKRDEDVRKPKSENFRVFGASFWQFKATSRQASALKVVSLKRELNFASEKLSRKKIWRRPSEMPDPGGGVTNPAS